MATKKSKPNGLHFSKDRRGKFRWEFWQSGQEIVASTQGYAKLYGAERNLRSVCNVLAELTEEEIEVAKAEIKS